MTQRLKTGPRWWTCTSCNCYAAHHHLNRLANSLLPDATMIGLVLLLETRRQPRGEHPYEGPAVRGLLVASRALSNSPLSTPVLAPSLSLAVVTRGP